MIVNDPIVIPFKTNQSLERIRLGTRFEEKESQIEQNLPIHKRENHTILVIPEKSLSHQFMKRKSLS